MKLHLSKAIIVALLAGTCAYAEAVTETVIASESTTWVKNTTETINSTYASSNEQKPSGSSYNLRFKQNLKAENSTFSTPEGYRPYDYGETGNVAKSGSIIFDGTVEAKNCQFTGADANSGNFTFNKKVVLNGGNTFTSRAGQNISFIGGVTANGNNTFIGGISANDFVVQSGVQTFTRENNTSDKVNAPTQTLTFKNIGFAADADKNAQINISAINSKTHLDSNGYQKGGAYGQVNFFGVCEISNLEVNTSTGAGLNINGTLTIRDSVSILGGNVTFVDNSVLIFEIDSLSELMDSPAELASFGSGDGTSPMLDLAEGVELGDNAQVELLFTENAINEMKAYEGPITFNLEKVTNVANVELNLTIQEDLGMSAADVFGSNTTFTTGEAGSTSNNVTIQAVPEPTTATLSLLALAGLCARRRRK